jgi:putative spermidine/putrescine transport system permease protein
MSVSMEEASSSGGKRTLRVSIPLLLLVPSIGLFLAFFVLPIGVLAINSLHGYSRLSGIIPIYTFNNYKTIFLDSYYLDIIGRTLRLAFLTSFFTLLIGYPVALYLTIATPRHRAWTILFIISPLLVSVIVRTFGWLVVLGPNGLVESALGFIHIRAPSLLHSESAVVIGLTNVLLPFLVLSIATSLLAIDPSIHLAAASLGANPWRSFWKVTVPLSIPGIVSGLMIVFSLASSSFVTPALLGGANFKVMSVVVYQQAMVLVNWPFAAALALTLVVIVVACLAVQTKVIEGRTRRLSFR